MIGTSTGKTYEDEMDHYLDRPMQTEMAGGSGIPGLPPIGHDAPPIVPEQSPNLEILRQMRRLPQPKVPPLKPGEDKRSENDSSFHLIRHGATDESDKMRGWNDLPLNKEGKEEAVQLGEDLKDSGIKTL